MGRWQVAGAENKKGREDRGQGDAGGRRRGPDHAFDPTWGNPPEGNREPLKG